MLNISCVITAPMIVFITAVLSMLIHFNVQLVFMIYDNLEKRKEKKQNKKDLD